jgi:hypothetical protein
MVKKRLPRIVAVLMIVAGVLNILLVFIAISGIVDPKGVIGSSWAISPLPYFGVATGFTGRTGLSNVLAVTYLAGVLAAIAGGIILLFRNSVVPWIIGTIGALLCFPLLGIASTVVTVLSRPKSAG